MTRLPKLGRKAMDYDPLPTDTPSESTSYGSPSLQDDFPELPTTWNWAAKVKKWNALGNKRLANCTAVAVAHAIQSMRTNVSGHQWHPTLRATLAFYEATSGYQPGHPETDIGADLLTVMQYWDATGFGKVPANHELYVFRSLNWNLPTLIRRAVWLFGGVILGLALPISVQQHIHAGSIWDIPPGGATGDGEPGSWGLHAVTLLGFDIPTARYAFVSWNAMYVMTNDFLVTYGEEAWALYSQKDWAANGVSPLSHDIDHLNDWFGSMGTPGSLIERDD